MLHRQRVHCHKPRAQAPSLAVSQARSLAISLAIRPLAPFPHLPVSHTPSPPALSTAPLSHSFSVPPPLTRSLPFSSRFPLLFLCLYQCSQLDGQLGAPFVCA
eukprot:5138788-Pleurochrysis_carterae.AAC.1